MEGYLLFDTILAKSAVVYISIGLIGLAGNFYLSTSRETTRSFIRTADVSLSMSVFPEETSLYILKRRSSGSLHPIILLVVARAFFAIN